MPNSIDCDGEFVLLSNVDNTFDHTVLPEPVLTDHRLKLAGEKIVRLTCRLAEV